MKHRAPKVAPPRHDRLEQLRWYPIEPVRWDMGLMSAHTMPMQAVAIDAAPPAVPASAATATATAQSASSKSSDRNLALNSIALMLSTAITGVLGLLFWAAAGRLYPVPEVGSDPYDPV